MTTLTSGRIAPRVAPSGPNLWERLLSQVSGFYTTFMDAQSLAFKRVSKNARARLLQGE